MSGARVLTAAEYAEVVRFGIHEPDVLAAMEDELEGSDAS